VKLGDEINKFKNNSEGVEKLKTWNLNLTMLFRFVF
jgi:hypothetical protein